MKQQFIQAKSWEERYRLIIQASKNLNEPDNLDSMPEVPGCEARVKLEKFSDCQGKFYFKAYSEARIMNGLLWLLLQEINGKTAEELHHFNLIDYFNQLGISQRLTATKLNGLQHIQQILHSL